MQSARIAFNPNIVARGDMFFGREAELDILVKRITHGQNVLITGERRIGKTSLLSKAYELIESQIGHSLQIWIEGDSRCSSVLELASEISAALHQSNLIRSPPDFSSGAIKKTLAVLQAISREGARLILFINDLDDFARIANSREDASDLSSFLRSVLDLGHVLACATSFRRLTPTQTTQRAPLLNVFNELNLGPFLEHEASYFLSESSLRSGDRLLDSECEFFTELVGLAPLHLQVAGFSLFAQDDFIESTGEKRLDCMVIAIEQTVPQLTSHWLYAIDALTSNQRSLLGRAARDQALVQGADLEYLKQRGFISSGEDTFKSMGSLYRDFLMSVDIESGDNDPARRSSYWSFTRDLAQAAIKTLIESGIKTYVK